MRRTLPHTVFTIVARLQVAALFPIGAATSQAADATTPNPPSAVNYLKRLSLEELLKIEVTSVSRRPEPFAATASAISVLTGDEIRRTGALTLADALRFSSGLQVARIDDRTWGIASRGFNLNASNKLLVMMDGRSLYTPLFAGVFWDVQDTELADLDRIEVVRGPGATMWGANAVNGVISIDTKNARDTQGTLISAGAGNEERQFSSFRHGLRVTDGVFARVYAKQFYRDDLRTATHVDTQNDWQMWQGGFRMDGEHLVAANDWTLQGDLYHGFIGSPARLNTRLAGGNLLGRFEHRFDADTFGQLRAYYDRVERFAPGQFGERRNTYDIDAQLNTIVASRHHVVVGGTGRSSADRTLATGSIRFSPPDRRMEVASGFVQDEILFDQNRAGLTLGAKFEHNTTTGFEFQPAVRAAWWPNPNHTLWAAISRAARTPSRFDDDLRFGNATTGIIVRGDPNFLAERLTAYEVGYRTHPAEKWSFDVSLFFNDYDRLRSQEFAREPGVLLVLRNQLNAQTHGGEVSVMSQLTEHWRVRATYARFDKRLTPDPGSTDPTRGSQEGNDPRHHATLVSSWDLPRGWEFDAMARSIGALPSPAVPAYTELDLRLGWRPTPAWELSVTGQNLLDRQHREFGPTGAATIELQRSYYLKVTWRH